VPPDALQETTAWLLDPPAWDDPKGDPGFSDLKLARIQFAAALTEAFQTAAVNDKKPLTLAAERLLADQEDDGSWDVDVPGVVGSPATYGDALGTYMALRTLTTSGESRFAGAVARADAWFLSAQPAATVDVCAVTLALADRLKGTAQFPAPPEPNASLRHKHHGLIERLVANQNSDGGWGPYPKSPSEPFDAAVAVLALGASSGLSAIDQEAVEKAVAQGRKFLIGAQLPAGGWIETTRPSGFQSYAQHISTSGWATLALLKTRDHENANEPR
jgi:squalene cyclase